MAGNLRISTFSGALLAAYFIPAWTITAFKIVTSPIHGLYERPNISLALFVTINCSSRIGHRSRRLAVGVGRMTVVAFLAVFLVLSPPVGTQGRRVRGNAGMALSVGCMVSLLLAC